MRAAGSDQLRKAGAVVDTELVVARPLAEQNGRYDQHTQRQLPEGVDGGARQQIYSGCVGLRFTWSHRCSCKLINVDCMVPARDLEPSDVRAKPARVAGPPALRLARLACVVRRRLCIASGGTILLGKAAATRRRRGGDGDGGVRLDRVPRRKPRRRRSRPLSAALGRADAGRPQRCSATSPSAFSRL